MKTILINNKIKILIIIGLIIFSGISILLFQKFLPDPNLDQPVKLEIQNITKSTNDKLAQVFFVTLDSAEIVESGKTFIAPFGVINEKLETKPLSNNSFILEKNFIPSILLEHTILNNSSFENIQELSTNIISQSKLMGNTINIQLINESLNNNQFKKLIVLISDLKSHFRNITLSGYEKTFDTIDTNILDKLLSNTFVFCNSISKCPKEDTNLTIIEQTNLNQTTNYLNKFNQL